jgi:restriction system protein
MSVPAFKSMMLPLLEEAGVAGELTSTQARQAVVRRFSLTEADQAETLKSGQLIYANRTSWALTYLHKASLVDSPSRGTYRITQAGRDLLAGSPAGIDWDTLRRYPGFVEWQEASHRSRHGEGAMVSDDIDEGSPEEAMATAAARMESALEDEVLQAVVQQDPWFFERLVVRLLEAMGYGESIDGPGMPTRKSGDEGIDGIVKQDRLGFDSVYMQAKRRDVDSVVGRPDVQKFVGALSGKGARKGLYITTAGFSAEAREYAANQSAATLVLVDGHALARLMIEYGVGVSTKATYEVKAIDSDFFDAE